MWNDKPAPIKKALERIRLTDHQKALAFKTIEKWRDGLLEGNPEILGEVLSTCPDVEKQRLKQLSERVRKEPGSGRGENPSRVLFRYLKEVSGG